MRGYTLIEVLVGLTIIGIVFSAGFVSFREFSRRQTVVGVAKQIKGDLRLAQSSAISGKKPTDCTAILNGFNFRVVDVSNYALEADCRGALAPAMVKNVTLPSGVTISVSPSPNPIVFKALGQGTNITLGGSATLTLIQTGTNNQATITVTAGGEIK